MCKTWLWTVHYVQDLQDSVSDWIQHVLLMQVYQEQGLNRFAAFFSCVVIE